MRCRENFASDDAGHVAFLGTRRRVTVNDEHAVDTNYSFQWFDLDADAFGAINCSGRSSIACRSSPPLGFSRGLEGRRYSVVCMLQNLGPSANE
jgi:hypothetical protein